jgi:competence/damage-inducible protein CinA-like protein
MPIAEIITIGTEILLGEIDDTNATFLARQLRDVGVDVYRKVSIGDNPTRIATVINEALSRSDIIITTGGLGPTVDDPTRQAVALALDVELEFHPELWEQIQARFQRYQRTPTENNRRQAYIPQGAIAIENPVGTAPAFAISTQNRFIACIPGVPREMEYLTQNAILPMLKEKFNLHGVIKTRTLHTIGIGESLLDSKISDLETLSNPTVGLAAHSGQVDIRITAKADSEFMADELIHPLETELRSRLGDWIYGADDESIQEIALRPLRKRGWRLSVCEAGTKGALSQSLASQTDIFVAGQLLSKDLPDEELRNHTLSFQNFSNTECAIGLSIIYGKDVQSVHIFLVTPAGQSVDTRPYGGPPQYAPRWGVHHCLDIIRRIK